jgi:hypothetical protein
MKQNAEDCLLIAHDTFLVARTQMYGETYDTRCLHRDVWNQTDRHYLADGEHWRTKYAYYYYWAWRLLISDDLKCCASRAGHNWHGPFVSRQEAFSHAYSNYGPALMPNDFEWRASWRQLAAKTGLTIPVVVTRRSQYEFRPN